MRTQELLTELDADLERDGPTDENLLAVLDKVLVASDCPVGTVHTIDPETGELVLRAHRGVPDSVMDPVRRIPIGKGMAGLAAQRREAVQVCNLQTDESGVAKPAARDTKMAGSVAFPMLDGDRLAGTMGVAKPIEYDYSPEECERLMSIGALVARYLA